MTNEEKMDKLLDKVKSSSEKIKSFSELLDSLSSTDSKKKALWKEIYENAVSDRERASILYTEAYKAMGQSSTDHVAIGSTMTKYLERMCKSNDQILSLADLIQKSEAQQEKVNPNELFDQILGD